MEENTDIALYSYYTCLYYHTQLLHVLYYCYLEHLQMISLQDIHLCFIEIGM